MSFNYIGKKAICFVLSAFLLSYSASALNSNYPHTESSGNVFCTVASEGSELTDFFRHGTFSASPVENTDCSMPAAADCISAPVAFEVWGSGEFCNSFGGYSIGITGSETDAVYSVYILYDGRIIPYWASEEPGTGGPLTFNVDLETEYFILGRNDCDSAWMTGSAVITSFNSKAYIVAGENNVCSGTEVTFKAIPERKQPDNYVFQWMVNLTTVFTGGDTFSYIPQNGDQITAEMREPCPDIDYTNNSVIMMVKNCPEDSTQWTGNSGSSWNNPSNWTNGLPGPGRNAYILEGAPVYPTLTQPVTFESLIIDGGSFIGAEHLNIKSAMVAKNIESFKYQYLSSPMAYPFPTVGAVLPDNHQSTWVRYYREATGNWDNLSVSNQFDIGTAYSVRGYQPQTARFIGRLNQSSVFLYVQNNNQSNNADYAGWNLLGNPYTSAIAWNMISLNAVESSVYVWNGSQYLTWNGSIGSLPGGLIPPMSGFFVKAAGSGYVYNRSITIPLSARVHSNQTQLKSDIPCVLQLNVSGNNYSDNTYIRLNNAAAAGFSVEHDARKLYGIDEAPQIFSWSDGEELSINEIPFSGKESVEIGFSCGSSGEFNLTAENLGSFSNSTLILLEDKQTGTLQNLTLDNNYTFSYLKGENSNRFTVHLIGQNEASDHEGIKIHAIGKSIAVSGEPGVSGILFLFDLSGRQVMQTTLNSSGYNLINTNVSSGPYVVKIISSGAAIVEKIMLQ